LFTVKFLGWIRQSRTKADATPPAVAEDVKLLAEIRDLLKARAQTDAVPKPMAPLQ
jgi:large-conductance mechanosensitive channel